MKRIIVIIAAIVSLTLTSIAEVFITKVDKVSPTDEMFMEMAVTAAKKSILATGQPCGAVVILNGAWRSTGIPTKTQTAELVALEKSRRKTLKNASVYTINEPTTQTYIELCKAGAEAIYFVNSRADVVAAGIYPADAYDDSLIPEDVTKVPLKQLVYTEASELITK